MACSRMGAQAAGQEKPGVAVDGRRASRRAKSIVCRLLFWTCLSIGTTLLMGWACAWLPIPSDSSAYLVETAHNGSVYVVRTFGSESVLPNVLPELLTVVLAGPPRQAGGLFPDWSVFRSGSTSEGMELLERNVVQEDARGWPLVCLSSKLLYISDKDTLVAECGWLIGGAPRVIPYCPIWPGMLVDSVLYGAALLIARRMLGIVIELSRRRRGRCPKCAYDIRGEFAPGCSECGWRRGV